MRFVIVASSILVALAACSSGPPRGLPDPSALQARGEALISEGHAREALELFRQAFSTSQGSRFISAIGLARASIALGDWKGYESSLQIAMTFSPGSPEADDLLGRTMLEAARRLKDDLARQNAALAASFFTRARSRAPDIPGLSYHMGLAMVLQGRYRESVRYLEASLRENPGLTAAMDVLVDVLRRMDARRAMLALLAPREKAGSLAPRFVDDLLWARGGTAPAPGPGGATQGR